MEIRFQVLTLGIALGLASGLSCTGAGPQSDVDTTCDPFAAIEHELSLGSIIAAGRHADGTIYVVDQAEHDDYPRERVFRSRNDRLELQNIGGMASSSGGSVDEYIFDIYGDDEQWMLMVRINLGEVSMYYQVAEPDMEITPETGDPLTLLDNSVIEAMTLAPDVETPELDFAADVAGGQLLVLVCDPQGFCPEEGRLFFGTADSVVEREVTEVVGSCCETIVSFRVDDEIGYLTLPFDGTASLRVGEMGLALTPRGEVDGVQFTCDPTLADAGL